jgi:hypothetical protein
MESVRLSNLLWSGSDGCTIGQYGSPFSDGTPQASQWPIPPGKYFDYEFKFDLNVSGTLYIPRLLLAH